MSGRVAGASRRRALLGALRAKQLAWPPLLQKPSLRASWSAAVVLGALLCGAAAAAFPRAVAFFLPLVATTAACCVAAGLSVAPDPERGAAKGAVLVRGDAWRAEAGLLAVYDDADASAYGGRRVQVGCFLRSSAKLGVDEDGEEVVFAGRLLVPAAAPAGGDRRVPLDDELVALQVDRVAESAWNSYFGQCSSWNHYERDGCDD